MLCIAVGVDGVLGAADELTAAVHDELCLVEAEVDRPGPWVDSGAFHGSLLVLEPTLMIGVLVR
jgi:hypothetical protein